MAKVDSGTHAGNQVPVGVLFSILLLASTRLKQPEQEAYQAEDWRKRSKTFDSRDLMREPLLFNHLSPLNRVVSLAPRQWALE